jgi:hypothetical protein
MQLPAIPDDRPVWDVAFFANRHALSPGAIMHHMRSIWGKTQRGKRRRLTYEQTLRFDRYVQCVRQKPGSATGMHKMS